MFVEEGSLPVWLSFQGAKTLIYPHAELLEAIANPETTAHRHLLPRAMEWRERLSLK